MKSRIIVYYLITLLSIFFLSFTWEFYFEEIVLGNFLSSIEKESTETKWLFIFSATFFSAIALIIPSIIAFRYIKKEKESENNFRGVIDNSSAIIFTKDLKGRYLQVNRQYEELFHVTEGNISGKTDYEVFPKRIAEEHLVKDQKVLKTGTPVEFEEVVSHDDGLHTLLSVKFPLLDLEGHPKAVCGISTDITELKKAEKELRQYRNHLKERVKIRTEGLRKSLEEKEILLKEVHHRTKNNMQIISSLLSHQSREVNESKYLEMFKECSNRIYAMSLIHETMYESTNFSKIDFKVYLTNLCKSLFHSYGTQPDQIKLVINSESIFLDFDSGIHCGLLVQELVSNSLKHAFPEGRSGTIQISLRSLVDEKFELLVRDDGIGFPEGMDFQNIKSMGLRLVTTLAEKQLEGTIDFVRDKGSLVRVIFEKGKI